VGFLVVRPVRKCKASALVMLPRVHGRQEAVSDGFRAVLFSHVDGTSLL
jgi:hypothetical protein